MNGIVCGVELSGHDAIPVLIECLDGACTHIDCQPKRISLPDDEDSNLIRSFQEAMKAFVRENGVSMLAIRKRAKRGRFAGGSVTFKMEALIQLIDDCQIQLVPPQTIAAYAKKCREPFPETLNGYQRDSYLTALAVANQK